MLQIGGCICCRLWIELRIVLVISTVIVTMCGLLLLNVLLLLLSECKFLLYNK